MTGGSQSVTSKTTNEPLPWMLPSVQKGIARSDYLATLPYAPYPYVLSKGNAGEDKYTNLLTGQTTPYDRDISTSPFQSALAPLSAQQLTSIADIKDWANQPSNVLNTASQQLTDTMGGSYLNPQSNAFLAQFAQQAMGDVARNYQNTVMPQTDAAATRAGAYGGSAHRLLQAENNRNLGDTLSKTATNIYYPAYNDERTRQLQAQLFAPQLDQSYMPHYQAGLAAGDIERQAAQDYLTEIVNRYNAQNQWPYQAGQAGASIYGPYAGNWGVSTTNTTSQGGGASPFSQILGGALMGLGTLGSFGTGGGSTVAGGILKNLFGL